jgi:hypothetical protein
MHPATLWSDPFPTVWPFALGLMLWTVLLLWAWVQVGRSLTAPTRRDDDSSLRRLAGREPGGAPR